MKILKKISKKILKKNEKKSFYKIVSVILFVFSGVVFISPIGDISASLVFNLICFINMIFLIINDSNKIKNKTEKEVKLYE